MPREPYSQDIFWLGIILSITGWSGAALLPSGWGHGIVPWSQLEESDLSKSQNGSFVKHLQTFTGSLPLTYCLSKYFFYKGLQQTITTQNKNYLLPRVTYPSAWFCKFIQITQCCGVFAGKDCLDMCLGQGKVFISWSVTKLGVRDPSFSGWALKHKTMFCINIVRLTRTVIQDQSHRSKKQG